MSSSEHPFAIRLLNYASSIVISFQKLIGKAILMILSLKLTLIRNTSSIYST